ncbi:MAG: hypothetical protein ACP5O3_03500 [Candidatus Micrarchaeia archaeon]
MVALESEKIDTIIDRLVEYVDLNGRVKLSSAARALGVSEDHLERVALLLEESGLLFVRYSFSGVELVSRKGVGSGKEEEKRKGRDERVEEARQLQREIAAVEGVISFMEKDLTRRLSSAEEELAKLERSTGFTASEISEVKRSLSLILQQAAMFEDEINKLRLKEERLRERILDFQERLSRVEARSARERGGLLARIFEFLLKLLSVLRNVLSRKRAALAAPPAGKTAADLFEERERLALKTGGGRGEVSESFSAPAVKPVVLRPPAKKRKRASEADAEARLEALKKSVAPRRSAGRRVAGKRKGK